ncbi:peptidase M14 [Frondihabitans sucicola]|uniref:Peptidase M14 n=1 Tax=Frondihabitans sucicola TaxID=1268041 RepID=A0ABN6Y2H3_9MICO|nr:peptidase M14 [Frondihabitans sucicola]
MFPAYDDNPYITLLTLAARARGYEFVESTSLEGLERTAAQLGSGDALHLHWTAPIVQRASSADEAATRAARFRTAVDGAASRGARVLWTLHNVVPHDVRHEAIELELCRYLAERADVIHTMTDDVAEVAAPFYALDARKIVVIPHPSYQGVYPSQVDRGDARSRFGLAEGEHAILFFGQLRPYKGLDALLSAVALASPRPPVLLLAGRAGDDDRAAIEALLPDGVRVITHYEHVDDADVQRWFRAADVAVLPYRRVLNSGTLHLAATFGLPVVLPDEVHLRRAFGGEEWIAWFDPARPVESLADLLGSPTTFELPREAAAAFSHRLAPYALSERYADLLDARLG